MLGYFWTEKALRIVITSLFLVIFLIACFFIGAIASCHGAEIEAGEPVTIGVYATVNEDMMLDGVCYQDGEVFDCEDAGIELIPSEDTLVAPAPVPQENQQSPVSP